MDCVMGPHVNYSSSYLLGMHQKPCHLLPSRSDRVQFYIQLISWALQKRPHMGGMSSWPASNVDRSSCGLPNVTCCSGGQKAGTGAPSKPSPSKAQSSCAFGTQGSLQDLHRGAAEGTYEEFRPWPMWAVYEAFVHQDFKWMKFKSFHYW